MEGHSPAIQWRLKKQRYGLVGEVCPHCDYKIFPPRDVCPNCSDEAQELYTFDPKSEIRPRQSVTAHRSSN